MMLRGVLQMNALVAISSNTHFRATYTFSFLMCSTFWAMALKRDNKTVNVGESVF